MAGGGALSDGHHRIRGVCSEVAPEKRLKRIPILLYIEEVTRN